MKRLVPVLAVFGICLLACLGWVAGRPQTVSANFVANDEHHKDHNGDNDRDKDRDKDRNNDDHSIHSQDYLPVPESMYPYFTADLRRQTQIRKKTSHCLSWLLLFRPRKHWEPL